MPKLNILSFNVNGIRAVVKKGFGINKADVIRKAIARLVEDEAHGALGVVGAHVDHRLGEARIGETGHRHQQLAGEIGVVVLRVLRCRHGPFSVAKASHARLRGIIARPEGPRNGDKECVRTPHAVSAGPRRGLY